MNTNSSLPQGWYPDQNDDRFERYWNGRAWLPQPRPRTWPTWSPSATEPHRSSSQSHPSAYPGSYSFTPATEPAPYPSRHPGRRPFWQTWWLIVPALFMCNLFALPLLWLRQGTSVRTKGIITGAVLLFAVFGMVSSALEDPAQEATDEPAAAAPVEDEPPSVEQAAAEPAPSESAVPAMATVPSVTDMSIDRARSRFAAADLKTEVVKRLSWAKTGIVLAQRMPAGSKVRPGRSLVLVVAAPMPRVPDIVGDSAKKATSSLVKAGFKVVTTEKDVTSGPDGVVLTESSAGKQAEPGSKVELVVSNFVKPVVQAPPPPPENCTEGYDPCLTPASDYDCAGGSGNGPAYASGPIYISGSDPYDLDNDGDGVACEW